MKKRFKFVALLMVACMAFLLAGCDLFPQNTAYYLNQTVITATYDDGTEIKIDRREFLTAYNNYGSGLIENNGYSEKEAIDATVEALVNRKILLAEAKADINVVANVVKKQKELYYQTYSALISNAQGYEAEIRDDWDMPQGDFGVTETNNGTVYTPYQKQAVVVYDSESAEYRIKKVEDEKTPAREKTFNNLYEVKDEFLKATKNNSTDTFAKEEYRRYLASLKETQKTMGTTYSDEELVFEEIKRIYDNLEENEYISQYQESKQSNNGYSTITVSQVLNKYASMVSQSKFIYSNDGEKYKEDILGSFDKVNYFVNDEYFHVAHILVKFSDQQQARYDELKTLSNNGAGGIISAEGYETAKKDLYASIKGSVRDLETGEILSEDTVAVSDILKEIQVELANAKTKEQKDEAFRNLMYKYNEDDGIMNANYPYVVGETESKMVESFTNSSRELNNAGEYGAVSGLVESEYGVHIIYYMGKCENLVEFNSDGTLTLRANYTVNDQPMSDVIKLTTTYLNGLNNKTVFDLVYESLAKDNYSEFENINLNTIKVQKGIEVVTRDDIMG